MNGKIYAIGGNNASVFFATVEEYDPATDTWATKASMPTARFRHAAVSVNGKIYVIGGANGSGYLSAVEEYDAATNSWATKTGLPSGRHGTGLVALNQKIYSLGGVNNNFLASVEEYDVATDTWTAKVSLLGPRQGSGAAIVNGNIYAIGGFDGTSHLASVEAHAAAQLFVHQKDRPQAESDVRLDFGADSVDSVRNPACRRWKEQSFGAPQGALSVSRQPLDAPAVELPGWIAVELAVAQQGCDPAPEVVGEPFVLPPRSGQAIRGIRNQIGKLKPGDVVRLRLHLELLAGELLSEHVPTDVARALCYDALEGVLEPPILLAAARLCEHVAADSCLAQIEDVSLDQDVQTVVVRIHAPRRVALVVLLFVDDDGHCREDRGLDQVEQLPIEL